MWLIYILMVWGLQALHERESAEFYIIKENYNRRSDSGELFVKFQSDVEAGLELIQLRIDGVERCYKEGGRRGIRLL
jgi:hypothetical protein